MLDFSNINSRAISALPNLLQRWLPSGIVQGNEWVALNPRRPDRHRGSFRINLRTGKWADFATGDAGGDPISLAAYLGGISQRDAASGLAITLGMKGECHA